MSRYLLMLVTFFALGCSRGDPGSPPPAARPASDRKDDERLNVLQALKPHLGDLLRRARADEMCFVTFRAVNGGDQSDPPPDCLALLARIRPQIVAASSGEHRDGEYRDKMSGKAGVLLSIALDQTKQDQEVIVSLGFRRNGLDGFGFKVRVVKDGDQWVAKETFDTWVS